MTNSIAASASPDGVASPVTVAVTDGVAVVTVDNPPVNSLNDETLAGLGAAAASIAERQDVRAVVVTGAGTKAFLAGGDLRELSHALGDDDEMRRHVALTRPTFDAWSALEVPVVAALGGNAVGGGLEFALVCDLIVADEKVRVGLPEVTLGLIPGAGGTQRLPRRIGPSAARELLLLGKLVDAQRAYELGLVNVVAPQGEALATALGIAERLAALPAQAIRAAKRAASIALDTELTVGLDFEREQFLLVAATADAAEGAKAFLERRAATFTHAEPPPR